MATQQGGAEITDNGVCPTITAAAGMSGNNQPWICSPAGTLVETEAPAMFIIDSVGGQAERGWEGDIAPTLKATHYKCTPVISMAAGFCTEHSAKAGGIGFQEETAPTLRAGTIPACVYDARGYGDGKTVSTITGDHEGHVSDYTSLVVENRPGVLASGKDAAGTLMASMATKQCLGDQEAFSGDYHVIEERPVVFDKEVYQSGEHATGGHYISDVGPAPTLRTGQPPGVCVRHIVRRLTPTECGRLQGFPDTWGHPDKKEHFTDEEYRFWLEVRNTHAAINGRVVKEYTEAQMLRWYNKLHSDSAEYKMWGNGIALPPSLYCMQGIADALEGEAYEAD